MKKTLFLAAALLVAGVLCTALQAQTPVQVDGIYYLLNSADHTATVTYTLSETGGFAEGTYSGHLNIPETVQVYDTLNYQYIDYTVTAIGDNAFIWCPNLTQITIPKTVKTVGLNLLQRSPNVTTLKIADGADPIYFSYEQQETGEAISFAELAYSCTNLYLGRNVEVKSSLEWATPVFHSWSEVQHVIFGEYITEIPIAFCQYARSLQSVQINTPRPLPAGQRTFAFITEDPIPAPQFITLYVPEGQKAQYEQMDLWKLMTIEEMDIEKRYSIQWVEGLWDFNVGGLFYKINPTEEGEPKSVTIVKPQVWYLNPDGSKVSNWSSEFPYQQSEIVIPETVQNAGSTYIVNTIGDYAFRYSQNLTSLTIPNSVTTVGASIVEYTPKLEKLSIPESVVKVGWLAFARSGASEVTIPASASKWYDECCAFQESENLRSVTFAEGLTLIPARMFFGCHAIQKLYIPDSVTEIGEGTFSDCQGLSEIHLPASLETLHNRMFRGCPLRELEIPAGVKEVEESALLGTLLTKLTVNPNNKVFDSRDNCNAVIRTKDSTLVAACNGSFIPESVDSIGYEAFAELDGIRSLTLPKNLKHVAPQAFMNLNNLTVITSYIENPAGVLAEDAFSSWYTNPFEQATLYVPAGTLAAYKADENWAKFQHIVEMTAENKPASVSELTPVTNESDVTFTSVDETTDLTNTVVDNIYVTCDTIGGDTYDKQEGAFVFQTVVDELMISNILQNENNMDILRNNFAGIVLQVPAGEGTLTLTVKTTGERQVAITIKGMETALFEQLAKGEITFDYSVTGDAYVYIYPVLAEAQAPAPMLAKLRRHAPKATLEDETESNVAIYGVRSEVHSTISAVEDIEDNEQAEVRKVLEQGQVIIIRDGKRYNVLGTEVK